MSTRKTQNGVAGLMLLGAAGFGLFQFYSASHAVAELNAVRAERDQLRARLNSERERAAKAQGPLEVTRKEAAGAQLTPGAEWSKPIAAIVGAQMGYILAHPELQTAFLQQQTLRWKWHTERFFKTVSISADQQEKYWKLVEDAQGAELDWLAAQQIKGTPTDPREREQLANLRRENASKVGDEARALLGDEVYGQLKQFSATISERNVADLLASQLYFTDAPLSAGQADQLTQILTENRYRQDRSANASLGGYAPEPRVVGSALRQVMQQGGMSMMDWKAPITDAAMARAQSVLTATQFAALQRVQEQQVTQLKLAPPPPMEKK